MGNVIPIKDFLNEYSESMAEKVTKNLTVIHDPTTDKEKKLSELINYMKKKPFPSQGEIIKACYKSFISGNKAVYLTAECGSGKTLQGIAVSYILHKLQNIGRVLVLCPPTIVLKWIKEIKDSLHNVRTFNLNSKDVITKLEMIRKQPKSTGLEFYVIGRERAKTGFLWRPAVAARQRHLVCPKCGQELLDKDGYPLPIFDRTTQGRFKKKFSCPNIIEKWKFDSETGKHKRVEYICDEQLWQPDNTRKNFRKAIPARFIKSKMKYFFDLLIADEVHQFKNESGQGYAFGALASACKHVLCLTGTFVGGYSSDIYHLLFRTHPQLMIEDKNRFGNPKKFIERYGVLERITTVTEQDGLTTKAKRRTSVREKPGISPLLLGMMLLSNSVFFRLGDCMARLQPYSEEVIELSMGHEMGVLYNEFEATLKEALREALVKGDNSLLGGYLHALLSYPERIYKGVEVIHPHTKEPVAYGPALKGIMPKEHELINIIKTELEHNRKVLVYYQNSDTTDISPRLVSMMEQENIKVKVLKSGNTERRAQIIQNWVEKGAEVIMTNPKKVEVGMDLLSFPSIIFYQIPMSTYTLRQASRRSWRIPQKRPVKVYFLTYTGTMQTRLMKLIADKLMTSLAIEGELSDKGLAALSESSDSMAKELAKMLVEKAESGDECLKDIWANYRKREVQFEIKITGDITEPEPETERILKDEQHAPTPEIKKASKEVEKIGDKIVKVEFTEYVGKRKKKVTRIQVTHAELDEMMKGKDQPVQVQYTLF
jgi:superfamily II DNA or RNA helicase